MHKVIFTPSGKRGDFAAGTNLLQAARQLGVDIDSVCGGRGICGRCQIEPSFGSFAKFGVESDNQHISAFGAKEERYKDKRGLADTRRLSCSCTIEGDLVIDVPEESQMHRQVIRKEADTRPIIIDPIITLHYIEVDEPDMHHPSGDLERVITAIDKQWDIKINSYEPSLLPYIQTLLRDAHFKVTAAVRCQDGRYILQALYAGLVDTIYGLAIDLGSTTMSIHLTNLRSGEVLAAVGSMNPQIRFGEDLMSRVSYVMMNKGGDKEMTKAVRASLQELALNAAKEAAIDPQHIVDIVLVGNPVMHHLFLGLSPVELGWAPFALATNEAVHGLALSYGFDLHPATQLCILPCIAGHVGADAASMLLSEELWDSDDISLLVDVGTNAEIIIGNKDRLLACSSPTGPALEGAQISAGQRAAPGAIERVRIDTETLEPRFKVIGCDLWSDEEGFNEGIEHIGVTGICGSGIIEVIGEMCLSSLIAKDGLVRKEMQEKTSRIIADGRTFSYILHQHEETVISVTQSDIRAIQLAKGALYAGCKLLIDKFGQAPKYIKLAGAFGSHIEPKYAILLGLIPDCDFEHVCSIGNAASTGARMALVNASKRNAIISNVRLVEKIETAIEPSFQDYFVGAMGIPHYSDEFNHLRSHVTIPDIAPSHDGSDDSSSRKRRRRR